MVLHQFQGFTHQVQKLTSVLTLQKESRSRNFHKDAKFDQIHDKKS